MPPFTGNPTLHIGSGPAIERTGDGGCTDVFYLAVQVGGSTCGPSVFVLDAPAQSVQRGQLLTITAPPGWLFSGAAVGVPEAWSMTIAPVSALANLGENDQAEIPAGLGMVLGSGHGPDEVATAAAPTSPGEYLLQFRDELARTAGRSMAPPSSGGSRSGRHRFPQRVIFPRPFAMEARTPQGGRNLESGRIVLSL